MRRLSHTIKCKWHPQSDMLFIEQPKGSPHAFKGVCKSCNNKFITWVSMSAIEEVVQNTPQVEIQPLPTTTFNKFFD